MNDSRPDLVTFGETMAVVRGDTPGPLQHNALMRVSCAGAESTVAIGLARLGHRAIWVGRTGADDAGELVRSTLRGAGVDVRGEIDHDRPTGLLLRIARTSTLIRVQYYRSGSAGAVLSVDSLYQALAEHPRIVHATGITPALAAATKAAVLEALQLARDAGALISFDVNYRSRLTTVDAAAATLRAVLPLVDVLFCGEDELHVLATALDMPGASLEDVLDKPTVAELVVKRGGHGAIARDGEQRVAAAAVPVTAVDVVGAGDAFVAGYLSGIADSLTLEQRLHRAAVLGAFSVASHGDWEGLPSRAELALLDGADGAVDFTDR